MKNRIVNILLVLFTSSLSFGQYYAWAKSMGGTENEYANSIQLDGSGNTYITGNFADTADFDPGPGVANLIGGTSFFDIFIAKYDNSGNYVWAKRIGGRGDDEANSLKLDPSGNVYVTGTFDDTVDFDPGPGTANLIASHGAVFMAKYDNSGNYLWAKTVGGSWSGGNDIELDASGNIYLTGYYYQTADFDPGPGVANLTGSGNSAFVAKYDNSGNYLWAKGISGSNVNYGNDLRVDASENVHLTGVFMGTSDFDPGAGTYTMTSSGLYDIFFEKFDNTGNFLWCNRVGGTAYDYSTLIQTDATGNVYLTGGFQHTVDFDPSPNTSTLSSNGDYDIFVAKYDNSGNYIWAKGIGGPNGDFGNSFQLDNSDNIYLTGFFSDSADFDPGPGLANLTSQGNTDIFIAKYDNSGNYIWAEGIGGVNQDFAYSLCKDALNNIYITGGFSGTTDFDPGINTATLTPAGLGDIFIAKYSSTPVGIKTIAADPSIKLYPNPFQNKLRLQGEDLTDKKLVVSDISGRILYEAIQNSKDEIDLSFLEKGIYYLKIQAQEQQKTFTIIKE